MIGMQGETRDRVRDQRIERVVELVSPAALLEELPLGDEREQAVVRGRLEVGKVLDARATTGCWLVVGPCSVHDVDAALDYAGRLADAAKESSEDLLVAMRVYFEKPRTTTGWKGLINDPYLDGSCDVNAGLRMARTLLLQVLDLGLPIGCEFLDPITPAVHLRHRRLGCDRSAHDREPDPPPARLRPVDADRLQEPHRRQRPGRRRCGPRRGGPPCLRRHRRRRAAGDPPHDRESRRSRHPARRPRGPELRRRGRSHGSRDAAHGRARRSGS